MALVELIGIAAAAAVGTAGWVVVILPRKWLAATVVAGLLVPLLVLCAQALATRVAFGNLSSEHGNAVGELDLWLLGLAIYDVAAALLCLGRVLVRIPNPFKLAAR